MNKLSYGLLSLLSTKPQTGYDLMLSLNRFWHTNHSAIYPLLSELEKKQYVRYTLIDQHGKPDKKVYNITENGIIALKEWITSALDDPVIKDEMNLKIYCLEILGGDIVETLLNQIEVRYRKQLGEYEKYLRFLQSMMNNSEYTKYKMIGAYILLQKSIKDAQLGIKWCMWIRSIYDKNEEFNFSKDFEKFTFEG